MWLVETEEQRKQREKECKDRIMKEFAEAAKKAEARERIIKSTTCPHCGRHDPVPPWLL